MSTPKITPKNLSYDASLPPFLQRLHNASTSFSASLDGRHERALARPKRTRDADAEAEDAPVVVDEETGEVVSVEQLKALGAGAGAGEEGEHGHEHEHGGAAGDGEGAAGQTGIGEKVAGGEERGKDDKHTATIGAARKRKAAKVVGSGGDDEDEVEEAGIRDGRSKAVVKKRETVVMTTEPKEEKMARRGKGKKVKLSFGDDEEG